MKITSASKKVLASALSAAMVVAFAPTVAFGANTVVGTITPANGQTATYYDQGDFLTAVAAAADGAVVSLEADLELAAGQTLAITKSITFNGNGHKLTTATNRATEFVDVNLSADAPNYNLTVDGLTIDGTYSGDSKSTLGTSNNAIDIDGGGETVTVSNITVKGITADNGADGVFALAETGAAKLNLNKVVGADATIAATKATLEESEIDAVVTASAGATFKNGAYKIVKAAATSATTIEDGTYGGAYNVHTLLASVDASALTTGTVAIKGGTFKSYVDTNSNANKAKVTVSGGTFSADSQPSVFGTLADNVAETQNADKTWTVGTGIAAVTGINTPFGGFQTVNSKGEADKAFSNAAAAWIKDIEAVKTPETFTFLTGKKFSDLYNTAMTVTLAGATFDETAVKGVTAASSDAAKAQKAAAEAINSAAKDLTIVKTANYVNATTAQYNKYFQMTTTVNAAATVSDLGEGNAVSYRILTTAVADYSDNNKYSVVFADGTILPAEVVTISGVKYIQFSTTKMGFFALAYKDTVAETKTELEQAKAEAEQAKKDLEAAKAELEAAKAPVAMTTYKSLKASKVKKAAQTITVAKGAKVVKVKTSSKKITVKSNKIKVAKGTKAGTYTAKVKVTPSGQATSTVTVTIVVK